ncbi:hypothetical protein Q7P35_000877 [Cladosporium inversicolor]
MAAPRSVQFIALRNLSRGSHQVRNLHMTGPATFPSRLLTKERPGLNLPHDIASLRNECKQRKLDFSGNKQDLISRLSADEITSSRAFSTAVEQSKRPTTTEQKTDSPSTPIRHFNTSRALKSVNDSSTIDFAYLPDFDPDNVEASSTLMMRVPIMPDNFSPVRTGAHAPEVETIVPKAEIVSASPFSIVLPMSDSHDGHANGIDFHAVTDFMTSAVKKPVEKQVGVVKEIWNSMLDDVMGAGGKRASPA